MPITKQVIKRMKQNQVARTRNRHYGSRMKSLMKLIFSYVQTGDMAKAKKVHPEVVKAIDTAAKKKIIHENNAARKKSRVQRAITSAEKAGVKPKAEKEVKKPAVKKEVSKKVEVEAVDEKKVDEKA